jgi:ATP-dependent RNA helicase RhlE
VINYELPHTPEDYVHRIGRTGRAGLPGEAISLVSPEEIKFLEDIERMLKRKLPRASTPDTPADIRPAHRPREVRHERGGERHAPKPQPAASPRPAQAGFDYTKPYEPASSDQPARPEPGPFSRRGPARPTAALLGGNSAKREPNK